MIDDFLTPAEIDELLDAGKTLCTDAPQEDRKVFSAVQNNQSKETYFLESGDKIRYFYEGGALNESGELLVDPSVALNKIGHALHTDHPVFNKITFSNRVKEICWDLGYRKPAIPQSMYIFKNPGVGSEVKSHQDGTYLFTEPNSVIGFWIALEDATIQNGCLQFIRGSHKGGVHRRYIRNPDKNSSELVIYDKPAPIYPISNFTSVPIAKGKHTIILNRMRTTLAMNYSLMTHIVTLFFHSRIVHFDS